MSEGYNCRMQGKDTLIDQVAHLARLKFDDSEKESIKKDLQNMIAFADKLNELNLDGVEPMIHMSDEVNVLRDDIVKGSVSREDALKNAPEHDDKFFNVPKVIKK